MLDIEFLLEDILEIFIKVYEEVVEFKLFFFVLGLVLLVLFVIRNVCNIINEFNEYLELKVKL